MGKNLTTIILDNYNDKKLTFTMPTNTYIEVVRNVDLDDIIYHLEIRATGDIIMQTEDVTDFNGEIGF